MNAVDCFYEWKKIKGLLYNSNSSEIKGTQIHLNKTKQNKKSCEIYTMDLLVFLVGECVFHKEDTIL